MDIHVTSDVNAAWSGRVRWLLVTLSGETLKSGEAAVELGPLASQKVAELDFSADVVGDLRRRVVLVAELYSGDTRVAASLATFAPNKHLELADPGLQVEVFKEGKLARFVVSAQSLARFVELKLEGADAIFSDNYFDVPAGWTVTVTCPIPAGWTLQKVRKALKTTSLYDSF
jgi:beta-mannosidase